jgi:drug/metabolite transporter (DMT)-like permease
MNFAGIGLAGSVALLWGLADTIAAIAARRIGTMKTTLIAQAGGLIALALVGVLASGQMSLLALSPAELIQSVLIGVLLGIVGAGAYFGLYRSLELGPLVLVSPIVGGQGAVTLILAVAFLHNVLDWVHLLLLLVILLGIVLTSTQVEQLSAQARQLSAWLSVGVRYALLSMLCFGVLSFGFGAATQIPSWFLVLFWTRLFSLLFVAITALVTAPPSQTVEESQRRTRGYLMAVGGGIVEVGGYLAFVFAVQLTSTAVAGVCASLVPLIPLLYGVIAYRERVNFNQLVGIVLALAGLIALPLDQQLGKWVLMALGAGLGCVLGAALLGRASRAGQARALQERANQPLLYAPWTVPAPEDGR